MSNETMTNQHRTEARLTMLDRVDSLPAAATLRARSYDLLDLSSAGLVVDVGCGSGRALAEMTERGADAVGIDVSEHMVSTARSRWPHAQFHVASAYELPFKDGEVSRYRADKVFHELDDPARALREGNRVLAHDGRIVLLGPDWDGLLIDSDDGELTRTIVRARADTISSPRVARRYRTLLLDNGFADVVVEAYTWIFTDATMLPMLLDISQAALTSGTISRSQADTWAAEQTERAQCGRMLLAVTMFVASARRD